jgi:hypothetical protein
MAQCWVAVHPGRPPGRKTSREETLEFDYGCGGYDDEGAEGGGRDGEGMRDGVQWWSPYGDAPRSRGA